MEEIGRKIKYFTEQEIFITCTAKRYLRIYKRFVSVSVYHILSSFRRYFCSEFANPSVIFRTHLYFAIMPPQHQLNHLQQEPCA
ncbi:hypothetical protein TSMEX_010963 [Taenia solium]|eukprot:TsM_000131800 transcript=TsM_000131800 gene=TsM_000131800